MKTGCIYYIKNDLSNKLYIGQTTMSPMMRWQDHYVLSKSNSQKSLYKDMREDGIQNFSFGIFENDIPINDLDDKEKYYINKYHSDTAGYNLTQGGNHTCITQKLSQSDVYDIYEKIRKWNFISSYCRILSY